MSFSRCHSTTQNSNSFRIYHQFSLERLWSWRMRDKVGTAVGPGAYSNIVNLCRKCSVGIFRLYFFVDVWLCVFCPSRAFPISPIKHLKESSYTLIPARFLRIEGASGNVSEHHTSRSGWLISITESAYFK